MSLVTSEQYYYTKWKHHSLKFILALSLLANAIIWSIVASLYGNTTLAISLVISAVFLLFMAVVEYRACDHFHTRYLRALCEPIDQPRL